MFYILNIELPRIFDKKNFYENNNLNFPNVIEMFFTNNVTTLYSCF